MLLIPQCSSMLVERLQGTRSFGVLAGLHLAHHGTRLRHRYLFTVVQLFCSSKQVPDPGEPAHVQAACMQRAIGKRIDKRGARSVLALGTRSLLYNNSSAVARATFLTSTKHSCLDKSRQHSRRSKKKPS